MTVKELIAQLAEFPADLPVVLDGYEDGLDDVINTTIDKVKFNTGREWWYGRHEYDEESEEQAVYLISNKRDGVNNE